MADFVTPLLLVHHDLQRSFTRSENVLLGHEEDYFLTNDN